MFIMRNLNLISVQSWTVHVSLLVSSVRLLVPLALAGSLAGCVVLVHFLLPLIHVLVHFIVSQFWRRLHYTI